MDMVWFAIVNDWAVLLPIVLCSVLMFAVAIERWALYRSNRCDVGKFVHALQRELDQSVEHARRLAEKEGGVIGEVAEEGTRILQSHPEGFERLFDITTSLSTRHLQRNLSILATIATISPYLGLFGTVIRILLTFGEMAKTGAGGGGAPEIMFGIGSALIATAFGLGVAIVSVTLNNRFHSVVNQFTSDFELLKLLFLSAAENQTRVPARRGVTPRQAQDRVQI